MMLPTFRSPDVGLSARNSRGEPERKLRFGLISPYTGSNLGDAAIIESARAHLTRLFPGAEFLLVVLDCKRVSKLHGVDSFPLTAVPRTFYFTPEPVEMTVVARNYPTSTDRASNHGFEVRSLLKRGIGYIPFGLAAARYLRDGFGAMALEARHLRQAHKTARNLDALIVAGGGQFDDEYGGPWGHPYSIFKWISLSRKLHVPVFLVGVGVDDLRRSMSHWFLRRAIAMALRVSLRDAGSFEILRRLGIRRELIVGADLAFGLVPTADTPAPMGTSLSSGLTIGLSPIAFGRPGSWPTVRTRLFERYWLELKAFAVSLLKANYSLKLFVTDEADYPIAKKLHDQLMTVAVDKDLLMPFGMLKLPELLSTLRSCDAIVASRLHGVLLSHISGIPVLAISYRRKVRAYMDEMGQKQFCSDFEAFTISEARQSLEGLLLNRGNISLQLHRTCADRYKSVEAEFSAIGAEIALNLRLLKG